MKLPALRVKIDTPAGQIARGRGFYQLEEDELYLPVEYSEGPGKFFSFLESDDVILHLDREGRLIFVEITRPRRHWRSRSNLVVPEEAERADIYFTDFRSWFGNPALICDPCRENLLIRFSRGPAAKNYILAENLIAQVDHSCHLVAIWARDFTDDMAGRKILRWRKSIREGLKALKSGELVHYRNTS